MSETTDLIARLRDNAQGISLGAEGMGWGFDEAMLNEAADALEQQAADLAYVKAASVFNLMEENKRQAAQIAEKDAEIARLHKALDSAYAQAMENGATANALRADAERMRGALNFIAEHMCSDWSQRCQAMVNTARAALRQEQPT